MIFYGANPLMKISLVNGFTSLNGSGRIYLMKFAEEIDSFHAGRLVFRLSRSPFAYGQVSAAADR